MRSQSFTPSSAISAGDLVQVVRGAPCCGTEGRPGGMGAVFKITSISPYKETGLCLACKADRSGLLVADGHHKYLFFVSRLKRIPPLSELEGVKTQEDIREPA